MIRQLNSGPKIKGPKPTESAEQIYVVRSRPRNWAIMGLGWAAGPRQKRKGDGLDKQAQLYGLDRKEGL